MAATYSVEPGNILGPSLSQAVDAGLVDALADEEESELGLGLDLAGNGLEVAEEGVGVRGIDGQSDLENESGGDRGSHFEVRSNWF